MDRPAGTSRWTRPRLVVAGLAAGVLLGLTGAVVADLVSGTAEGPDRAPPSAPDGGPSTSPDEEVGAAETTAAADAFVEAWARSRRGTFAVESSFVRRTAAGRELSARSVLVQRPPDRLVAQGGSVTGRLGTERLVCDPGPDEVVRCRRFPLSGPPQEVFAAEFDAEVERLSRYVGGGAPLYAVSADGPCFGLRLVRAVVAPPYGTRAVFCFDPSTGAPTRTEIERREGTDLVVADEIRDTVTDGDLEALLADVAPGPP